MVQLELGRSNAAPLGVARDLARRLQAPVTGVATAQPIQVVVGDGFYGGDIVREDSEWIEQDAQSTEAEFREEMNGHPYGLDWDMAITRYPLSDRIASVTSTADILVVGVGRDESEISSSTRRVDVDDLIMQTGRPILAVPRGVEHFDFQCALVAWKDTREARRAVADALPLLRQMSKVVIAEITHPAEQGVSQAGLSKMVAWLARHGVTAVPRLVLSHGDDGARLLALAEEEGAELIVAGAYGHSRLREWVLGGVTRNLLRHCGHCLLLSH
jgi:nucleotide-binding universal stress UspA family protein